MNTKVVPTMHQWQAARDMFNSRGCTHWGSVRLIIEAFLAAAPSLEEREGDEMTQTKVVPMELLPCPFCGGKAEFRAVPHEREYAGEDDCRINHDNGGEFIQCTNNACAANSMLIFPTMADAKPLLIEKWNRRSASPAPQERRVGQRRKITLEPLEFKRQIKISTGTNDRRAAAPDAAGQESHADKLETAQMPASINPSP